MLSGSEMLLGTILIVGLCVPFLFISRMFVGSTDDA